MELESPDGIYFEYLTKEGHRSKLTHFILLEYHTSWDWLMPVVEKIEDIREETRPECSRFNVCIEQSFVFIIETYTSEEFKMQDSNTKIEATYNAVVEFIKWYNKNI